MTAANLLAAYHARRTARAAEIEALRAAQRRDRAETIGAIALQLREQTGHPWHIGLGASTWLASTIGSATIVLSVGSARPTAHVERQGRLSIRLGRFPTIEAAAAAGIAAAKAPPC